MRVTAADIMTLLSRYMSVNPVDFDPGLRIDKVSIRPEPHALFFVKNRNALAERRGMLNGLGLVLSGLEGELSGPKLVVEKPRLAFALAVKEFFDASDRKYGIHPSAIVEDGAAIDETASIGASCFVGSGVKIGPRTSIGHNSVIHSRVAIGSDCTIRCNSVIGGTGFGVEEYGDYETLRVPHIGGVTIGDHVEIGNMCAVDAGTIDPTVIEDFVQIDNLVHIAHNCHVGRGSLVIACAEVSGSVRLGRGAYIGPNAAVMNGIEIAERTLVGVGAVVLKSTEPNAVMVGNPARKLRLRQ